MAERSEYCYSKLVLFVMQGQCNLLLPRAHAQSISTLSAAQKSPDIDRRTCER